MFYATCFPGRKLQSQFWVNFPITFQILQASIKSVGNMNVKLWSEHEWTESFLKPKLAPHFPRFFAWQPRAAKAVRLIGIYPSLLAHDVKLTKGGATGASSPKGTGGPEFLGTSRTNGDHPHKTLVDQRKNRSSTGALDLRGWNAEWDCLKTHQKPVVNSGDVVWCIETENTI